MDALTWFKSRFLRTPQDPALSRPDVATEMWADLPPLRPVLVIRQPLPAPAGSDEDWDAVIARARIQTVASNPPGLPRPPAVRRAPPQAARPSPPPVPRHVPPEMQVTPPPELVPQARATLPARPKLQWAGDPEQLKARLDALLSNRPKAPTAPYPPLSHRR